MRRTRWITGLVLIWVFWQSQTTYVLSQETDQKSESNNKTAKPWYKKVFGAKEEKVKPAKPTSLTPAQVTAEFKRQESILMKRYEVCDRINQLALETKNDELALKSENLRELAFRLYTVKITHLNEQKAVAKNVGTEMPQTKESKSNQPQAPKTNNLRRNHP